MKKYCYAIIFMSFGFGQCFAPMCNIFNTDTDLLRQFFTQIRSVLQSGICTCTPCTIGTIDSTGINDILTCVQSSSCIQQYKADCILQGDQMPEYWSCGFYYNSDGSCVSSVGTLCSGPPDYSCTSSSQSCTYDASCSGTGSDELGSYDKTGYQTEVRTCVHHPETIRWETLTNFSC